MKNSIIVILSLAIITTFISCTKENNGEEPDLTPKTLDLTAMGPEVIAHANEFGVELFTKVAQEENKNLMLSPLSASTALTMLLNGCEGGTYDQLKETLKYPESPPP
ncbi:MAG: serpin family protein [Bacteroidales bacterium]|jgi:serpin B|nr:serpin family protein [Bacteroidales bacterium]